MEGMVKDQLYYTSNEEKSAYTQKSSRSSRKGPRKNIKLAIPNRMLKAGGAQDTIKQRRMQRRRAKFNRQLLRLGAIVVPLGFLLVLTERMRQRALSSYIEDVESEVKKAPLVNVHMNQTDILKHTLLEYPFNGIADVNTPIAKSQTGFFWQIPRTGGSSLKDILGQCLYLVQASRTSSEVCSIVSQKDDLKICKTNIGAFVNCDPSDDHGIQRCRDKRVVENKKADVIVSARFLHALSMFDSDHQARAFTIMRDPVERMISTFYYLQEATHEREYSKTLKNMTLVDYAKRDDTPSNWMVRYLTGHMTKATMSGDDLKLAKEILENKFFVLLTNDMSVGIEPFLKHMRYKVSDEGRQCIYKELSEMVNRLDGKRPLGTDQEAVQILKEKNDLDIQLYEHAKKLFSKQYITVK